MKSFKYNMTQLGLQAMNIKKIFSLTGDNFKQNILNKYRNLGNSDPSDKILKELDVTTTKINGKNLYHATSIDKKSSKKVLYIHGGGYVIEAMDIHWQFISFLTKETGIETYFPQYPLAPENTCADAFEMLVEVYQLMLKDTDAKDMVIMGDSAGGGLSLALAMHIRELGLPQPSDIVMFSPAVLLESSCEAKDKGYLDILEKKDKMISTKSFDTIINLWRGKLDKTNYWVNPIYGDLRGLGKISIFSGTGEVLNIAARKFRDVAKEQKVKINYYEKKDMMHCWILMPFKESKSEREIVIKLLKL